MKYIKLAAISFLLLFALVMAITVFIPDKIRISRAVNINATPEKIRPYLQDLSTWPQWNAFVSDSVVKVDKFTADEIISGNFSIRNMPSTPDSIVTSWNNKGKEIMSGFNIIHAQPGVEVVQWYFDIKLKWYPWEKISSIVFDKQYGPLMEQSLHVLKTKAELR